MLGIMVEYVNVAFNQNNQQKDQEFRYKVTNSNHSQNRKQGSVDEREVFLDKNYFYIVESIAEDNIETGTWDGSVKTIKKFIERGIKRKIDKIDEEMTKNQSE